MKDPKMKFSTEEALSIYKKISPSPCNRGANADFAAAE